MTTSEAQQVDKTKIFLLWLIFNVVMDGIAAFQLNTIPYTTIMLTLLFSSFAVFGMNRQKINWIGTGMIGGLAAGFLYVLSLNLLTPLSIPYWVLFYPVIINIIAYIDQRWEPEGFKKFSINFAGFVLVVAGIVLYNIQFPTS